MSTIQEIAKLRSQAEYYQLASREILAIYSDEQLAQIYNGAGPDSWTSAERSILTDKMSLYKPVVLIHDVQFHESDGTPKTFRGTIADWRSNTRKVLDAEFPLWTWRQLSSAYRRERAYWLIVKRASDLAIAGNQAESAYLAAYELRSAS